ncbi:nitrite reductase/ring-hydroxylating ferredoxin subunit/DMSO/TMAO reductase YedYZ heme-binding membrane subunit [Bosea sp. OAE506]|uniref:Rieske 2Fe-2S domain-containing protein n=1 Tax=Bosea sp. OAE506 TaxID=2663870 RepID=UPI001789F925
MSVAYRPVGWTRSKIVYDAALLAGVALYLVAFMRLAPGARPAGTLLDAQSLAIKAFGSCAFLLLTMVLMIGPLARLDQRFLPLLYNRRHFGVITCAVAASHAMAVIDWYFAYSPLSPWVALLATDTASGELRGLPFIPFGVLAFLILLVLAATSHDFWLAFLGPPVWKAIHMSLYGAYGLVVLHIAFGVLQDARNAGLPLLVFGGAGALIALHLAAAWRERRRDQPMAVKAEGWVAAGLIRDVPSGRGLVVPLADGSSVAIFRENDSLAAISNLCAHQNGPLGEGRLRDGCVICPWHGYEYRLRDGCAPAPFTERVATYQLRLEGEAILLDPRPNPLGTAVEPLSIPGDRR